MLPTQLLNRLLGLLSQLILDNVDLISPNKRFTLACFDDQFAEFPSMRRVVQR